MAPPKKTLVILLACKSGENCCAPRHGVSVNIMGPSQEERTSLVPGVGGLVSAAGQDLGAVILLRLLLPQHLDPAVPPAGVSRGQRGGQGQGQGQDENASPGGGGRPHLLASAAGDGVIHPGSESGACTKGGGVSRHRDFSSSPADGGANGGLKFFLPGSALEKPDVSVSRRTHGTV